MLQVKQLSTVNLATSPHIEAKRSSRKLQKFTCSTDPLVLSGLHDMGKMQEEIEDAYRFLEVNSPSQTVDKLMRGWP